MASLSVNPRAIGARRNFFFMDSPARTALLGSVLAVATLAVYSPVHRHSFVHDDDYYYVVDNAHVHNGLDWKTVRWAFTAFDMVNWIPLTWLSHAVDYRLFGLNPAGHHDINAMLHALNAVLLFCVLKRATGFAGRSFMVAALFALHPINVEAVCWVAERKTMLSMVFFVLTLGAYRWYAHNPQICRYLLVAILYASAIMAKSQVIMLPLVLLLWDYWPLQRMFATSQGFVGGTKSVAPLPSRSFSWLVKEKVPLLVLAATDAAVTIKIQHAARIRYWRYPFSVGLENAVVAYVRYIGKALWPAWLAPYYPHPGNSLKMWQALGASALLLAITGLTLAARRVRYLAVGWLWFLVSLIPMIGIVQFGNQAMADRYAYEPFCGLFIMVCWSVTEWAERRHLASAVLPGLSVAVLVTLTTLTYRQVNYWGDDLALWSHALQVTSDNAFAEDRVGRDLKDRGKDAEAVQHFLRTLAINPANPDADLQVAFYEHQHGNLLVAIEHYKRVVNAAGSGTELRHRALINMGHAYADLGDTENARQCFKAANKLSGSVTHLDSSLYAQ